MRQALESSGEGSNERVAHVLAGENSGDRDPGWRQRRQVLGRVDCRVNRADKERGVDFFGEQALAARLGERSVLDNVAPGADDLERDPLYLPAVRLGQKAARLIRLRQRQGRSARAEGEEGGGAQSGYIHSRSSRLYQTTSAPGRAASADPIKERPESYSAALRISG